MQSIHKQGYPDVDFDAVDGRIQIGPSGEILRHTQTDLFNLRVLVSKLNHGGPWFGGNTKDYGGDGTSDLLVALIANIVDVGSWRDAGGATGQMTQLGNVLVVTQTPRNLALVARLLVALEAALDGGELVPVNADPENAPTASRRRAEFIRNSSLARRTQPRARSTSAGCSQP